jgi:hypothetical protein
MRRVQASATPLRRGYVATWLRGYAAIRAQQSPHLQTRSVEYDHGLIAHEVRETQ